VSRVPLLPSLTDDFESSVQVEPSDEKRDTPGGAQNGGEGSLTGLVMRLNLLLKVTRGSTSPADSRACDRMIG
jgi:hypothetical protein